MRRHVKLAAELLNQSKDTRRPLIVVLGASGFMGSAVVDRLAGLPVTVRAVARGLSPVPAEAVADVETHQVDLARPGALADAVEEPTPSSTSSLRWAATGPGARPTNGPSG